VGAERRRYRRMRWWAAFPALALGASWQVVRH